MLQVHYKRLQYAFVGVTAPKGDNDFGFAVDADLGYVESLFRVYIAGIDRTGFVKLGTIQGFLTLDGRDEFSMHLIDITLSYRPPRAALVEITHDGRQVVKGNIVRREEEYLLSEGEMIRNFYIYCRGPLYSLDRLVVWGETPTTAQLFGKILGLLQWNFVTTLGDIWGGIDFKPFPGPVIETQNFEGQTVLQAILRMLKASGESWGLWGTWNGNIPQLHIRDLATDPDDAPWDIADDDGNIIDVGKINYDDSAYANLVHARSEYQNVSRRVEQKIANGGADWFATLQFLPKEIISITLEGVPQTVGIVSEHLNNGDDSFDWYYQPSGVGEFTSYNIIRGPNTPVPANGDVMEVTYLGDTGNTAIAEDTAEQAAMAANMGFGSGRIAMVAEYRNVKGEGALQEIAAGILARAKQEVIEFPYRTWRGGIQPGQVQQIAYGPAGISAEFLISYVRFYERGDGYRRLPRGLEYEVHAGSIRYALPYPGKYMEDLVEMARGGSDPVSILSSGSGGSVSSDWYGTLLFSGTSSNPAVPITGDDQLYRLYILIPEGEFIRLTEALAFVSVAPGATSIQIDCRYVDPLGTDTGSIFAAPPVTILAGNEKTLVTTFRQDLVLEREGYLIGDCDQTDATARKLGLLLRGKKL